MNVSSRQTHRGLNGIRLSSLKVMGSLVAAALPGDRAGAEPHARVGRGRGEGGKP